MLALCIGLIATGLGVGIGTANAAGDPGSGKPSTWSDPPPRKADAAKPAALAPTPAAPVAAEQREAEHPTGMAVSRRKRSAARRLPRRAPTIAQVPHKPRPVAVARHPSPRMTADRPPPPVRYAPYPAYSAAVVPPDDEDERLDRLSTAVRSGYLVMRRRTVEYPDGRTIRIYRPADDGADD